MNRRNSRKIRRQPGCKVYVGGIPSDFRPSDLEDLFSHYRGRFDILLKSGFGFLEFDDYRDAEDAIYRLDRKLIKGQRISVEHARGPRLSNRKPYDSSGLDSSSRAQWVNKYGSPRVTKYRVIVKNLSTRVEWQDLKDLMKKAGEVTYVTAHDQSLHEGSVCFSCKEDMNKAVDMFNNYTLHERRLKVQHYPH